MRNRCLMILVLTFCICFPLFTCAQTNVDNSSGALILDYAPIICRKTASTSATAINNAGSIIGFCHIEPERGFVNSGATFQYIWYPGAMLTQAISQNDNGAIVGTFWDTAF